MSLDEHAAASETGDGPQNELVRAASGFDAEFLGVTAAMPSMDDAQAAASVELAYEHFTVLLDTRRRFAGVTAVNIDGARLVQVPREDRWEFDDRISTDLQAGPEVYANNDLDRGHLVRRNDPVWGDRDVAARANTDTFRFTNAAPQASGFNQSRELWLGLEDHVLEHARVHASKLSVFTGPVLTDDDPPYRGIRIPLKFWKIAAWNTGESLATTGFVVDQSPLVDVDELPRAHRCAAARALPHVPGEGRRHRSADRPDDARAHRRRAPAARRDGLAPARVGRRHPGLTDRLRARGGGSPARRIRGRAVSGRLVRWKSTCSPAPPSPARPCSAPSWCSRSSIRPASARSSSRSGSCSRLAGSGAAASCSTSRPWPSSTSSSGSCCWCWRRPRCRSSRRSPRRRRSCGRSSSSASAMLVGSFFIGGKRSRERRGPGRLARWRERAVTDVAGERGGILPLMGLAVAAAGVEVASMLPYLVGIGLISTSELDAATQVLVLAGYCVVMVLPALVLLGIRSVASRAIESGLSSHERLDGAERRRDDGVDRRHHRLPDRPVGGC